MTTSALRQTAFTLALLLATATLFAQGKDMGQANQYYKQNTRFKFVQPSKKAGGDVRWTVAPQGRVEVEKDEYALLENDVKVFYQDVTVNADKITINLKTKDVVAEGHVILDQGPTRLTASHAVFNLDSKTGTFFDATGSAEPSLYFTGEKLEKVSVDEYILTNGVFTSCDLDRPSWSFHVRSADITLDNYAHLKDLTFRAHDIPVFWAPRLIWPTKSDRSQGFLIPRLLFSNTYGQRIELGYFIPFGDSADTTVYADLNTKGYNGVGVDLRYRPTADVKAGELNAYAVRDPVNNKEQWRYAFKHAQDNLPGGFRGVVDVEDFSNLDFFRQYDRDPRLHTLSQIYSSAYLTKNRSTYSINLLSDRRDLILGTDAQGRDLRERFEQLPSLQFRVYPEKIANSPFYFSMESSASHLLTSGLSTVGDTNYYRADIFPTVSMQLRTPPWFSVKPQISIRETHYSASLEDPSTQTPGTQQQIVNDSVNRFYGQGQIDVVGPTFSRVFNEEALGFTKFKHVIEPRLRYVYTTNVPDQDRVIRFDTVDSPFLPIVRDSVEYSVTQRLIAKGGGENASAREILSLEIRQTVSLSKPFTDATSGSGSLSGGVVSSTIDPNQKFTPLTASLHLNPYQTITLDATTTFGNVSHQLDQTSFSANVSGSGKNADKYLNFTYFASYQQPGQLVDTSSSQIRLNSGASLWKDRVRGDVQFSYDAKNGKFLEQRYLLGGTGSCYGLALEFRRYLVYTPLEKADTSIGIAITLKNVGTIGTH